jgi:hypothetical protein
MPLNLNMTLISCARVTGAILLGILFAFALSITFPRLLSAYGVFGIMLNTFIGLVVLIYAEIKEFKNTQSAIAPKLLMVITFSVSLAAAIAFQLWMYLELLDSSMTSSLDGVLMRNEGKLTASGWLNIAEFIAAVLSISIIISVTYELIRRIRNK